MYNREINIDIENKIYLLFGMGKSNESIKRFFDKKHIDYLIYDDKKVTGQDLDFSKVDYIVKSPGVRIDHPLLKEHQDKIILELELFNKFKNRNTKVDIVTGTNGKTTVMKLIEDVCGHRCVGNNGYPLFDYIDSPSRLVIESSSFMGEKKTSLDVDTAIILNIFPSHLERHGSLKKYIEAKENLIRNAKTLIINNDNKYTRKLIKKYKNIIFLDNNKKYKKRIYTYSAKGRRADLTIFNNIIYYHGIKILDMNKLPLYLQMYKENTMATTLYALTQFDYDKLDNMCFFKPLEHRYEVISENPRIINDSKSTNFYALKKALEVTKENVILICGGKRKKENYKQINGFHNIRKVLICGENRFIISNALKYKKITYDSLKSLLNDLENQYEKDCTILFCPGSISYDEFASFEDRGKYFKEEIKKFLEKIKNRWVFSSIYLLYRLHSY